MFAVLSSHLSMSTSVPLKISHSDLNVFLGMIFWGWQSQSSFFCFLLNSFPSWSSFHLPSLEFCEGKGEQIQLLSHNLLNPLETLRKRITLCGFSSQKGVLKLWSSSKSIFVAWIYPECSGLHHARVKLQFNLEGHTNNPNILLLWTFGLPAIPQCTNSKGKMPAAWSI